MAVSILIQLLLPHCWTTKECVTILMHLRLQLYLKIATKMIEVVQPSCENDPAYLSRGLRDDLGSSHDREPMASSSFKFNQNGLV
jgi:hypothetical protein